MNVKTALANTIEVLENAPSKQYIKENFKKMVEKIVNQGIKEIRMKTITMKKGIVKKAREHVDKIQNQASKNMEVQLILLKK